MSEYDRLLRDLSTAVDGLKMDARHRYAYNGKSIPNVTTITGAKSNFVLADWALKGAIRAAFHHRPEGEGEDEYIARIKAIGKAEGDARMLTGTMAHGLIQAHEEQSLGREVEVPEVSDDAQFRFARWLDWRAGQNLQVLAVEQKLISLQHLYCGTADAIVVWNGEPGIIDWKCPAEGAGSVYDNYRLQSAAYRYALEGMGWPTLAGWIVTIPAEEPIKVHRLEDGDDRTETWKAFLSCLCLHSWDAKMRKLWADSKPKRSKKGEAA